jgi:deoxyribose-phosphate aldolase
MNYNKQQIADVLDLAVLKPTATVNDVIKACDLANKYKIKSVCVPPVYAGLAASQFNNVSCVIGFPHGTSTPDNKYHEAVGAVREGARELDVVLNYGCFLDGDPVPMTTELALIISMAHQSGVLVKAILETCFHTPRQIIQACNLCVDMNIDFVKTSTGFAEKGATSGAVELMVKAVKGRCGIKASGGIKTYQDVQTFLDLGCTRIGASSFSELLP